MIMRIGEQELRKRRNTKEATKATLRKLHQIAAVYQSPGIDYPTWINQLRATSNDRHQFRETCQELMHYHASTRERLPILEQFYKRIFADLPPISSILDLACGLNPLKLALDARNQRHHLGLAL
ncbi:hypothetical protein KFU94_03285 [Chloroflexi bacterium TSY]|nr:hypothetical protein [Chloroflexi bacterium TSY]